MARARSECNNFFEVREWMKQESSYAPLSRGKGEEIKAGTEKIQLQM